MNAPQIWGGLRPLPSPTCVGCAGSRTPLAVGRIRLHGLDALPNTWAWGPTHLRSLARSGNQLLPARRPVVSRSVGPTSLPAAVPAVGARVGVRHHLVARARRDRGCTPPRTGRHWGAWRSGTATHSRLPPMQCLAVGARHSSARPRSRALRVAASALGRLRVSRPSAWHLQHDGTAPGASKSGCTSGSGIGLSLQCQFALEPRFALLCLPHFTKYPRLPFFLQHGRSPFRLRL